MKLRPLLFVLLASCGAPAPPPASPVAARPSPTHRPLGGRGWSQVNEHAHAAFEALASNGPTEDVLAQFRDVVSAAPEKTRIGPTAAHWLMGALSDDGSALIAQYWWSSEQYRIDPKTGVLLGRRAGMWSDGPAPILAGTHLAVTVATESVPIAQKKATKKPHVKKTSRLVVYDAITGADVMETPVETAIATVSAGSSGSLVAWLSREPSLNQLHVWDGRTRSEVDTLGVGLLNYVHMPTSSVVLISSSQGMLVRDTTTHLTVATLDGDPVRKPPVSPDGKLLALATRRGAVMLLETATGKITAKATCETPGSLVFDKAGGVLAVGGSDRVSLFKVPALELIRTTQVMRRPDETTNQVIHALHFSADEKTLVGHTEDGFGIAYDVATGHLLLKRSSCEPFIEPERTTFVCRDPMAFDAPPKYTAVQLGPTQKLEEAQWEESDLQALGRRVWESRRPEPLRSALLRTATQTCDVGERVLIPKAACP